MIPPPPRSTPTDTLFPYPSLCLSFPTGDPYDPSIQLVATEAIEDVEVSINVSGRALAPQITFSSVPGLPQDEIVSRILFGDSITSLSPLQAVQLRSEEHTSELQSLMRISYAVFCLKKKNKYI